MAKDEDTRSELVRTFDGWPKPLRVVLFSLAVSLAIVFVISYTAQGRWAYAGLWLLVAGVWGLIGLTRLSEADRYDRLES